MKVSGFTFIRNAVKFDYPIREAILSILPLCDEVIVAVGNSDDDTLALIQSIGNDKIKIIETVWDDSLRAGGKVLAEETNKVFDHIAADADWAFYIQGDEVFHEAGIPAVRAAMEKYLDDAATEGLLFNYKHFYGSYDYIGDSRKWYRKEIRVVRNNKIIRSFKDAQGFRIHNRKLNVRAVDAWIYHYGWVKPPKAMQAKQESFNKLWHSDEWVAQNIGQADEFDYSKIDSLARFTGTHPQVIQKRVEQQNWSFTFDPTKRNWSLKLQFLMHFESLTGYRIGEYKNYRLLS